MAADTGDCTIFFYGSKDKLNELTFFMKEAWRVHCNSESYEVNRIDEYSWLGDYDEEWNVIHSLGQVNSLGYQLIPGFLKKVKEKFPELSIKGIVNHNWLICEGEEHMKITSESNSTEVNCEEWCLKELDLQDWESEEEQERAQAELEESWCSTEQEWQENLFNSEDLLRIDWCRLQSMLEQQMVVGTKYEDRPVNIAKLTDGEKVFLVREPENNYDANAIEVRSEIGSLGHIPAEISAKLSPLIDEKIIECEATVITTVLKLEYAEKVSGTKVLEKNREKLAKEPLLWIKIQIHKC